MGYTLNKTIIDIFKSANAKLPSKHFQNKVVKRAKFRQRHSSRPIVFLFFGRIFRGRKR